MQDRSHIKLPNDKNGYRGSPLEYLRQVKPSPKKARQGYDGPVPNTTFLILNRCPPVSLVSSLKEICRRKVLREMITPCGPGRRGKLRFLRALHVYDLPQDIEDYLLADHRLHWEMPCDRSPVTEDQFICNRCFSGRWNPTNDFRTITKEVGPMFVSYSPFYAEEGRVTISSLPPHVGHMALRTNDLFFIKGTPYNGYCLPILLPPTRSCYRFVSPYPTESTR